MSYTTYEWDFNASIEEKKSRLTKDIHNYIHEKQGGIKADNHVYFYLRMKNYILTPQERMLRFKMDYLSETSIDLDEIKGLDVYEEVEISDDDIDYVEKCILKCQNKLEQPKNTKTQDENNQLPYTGPRNYNIMLIMFGMSGMQYAQ